MKLLQSAWLMLCVLATTTTTVLLHAAPATLPGTWTTPVYYPSGRYLHSASCANNSDGTVSLMNIGGHEGASGAPYNEISEYNFDTGLWTSPVSDGLPARAGHGSFSVFDVAMNTTLTYVVAGYDASVSPQGDAYVKFMGKWQQVTVTGGITGAPVHSFGSWVSQDGNSLYMFGGMTAQGVTTRLNVFNASLGLGKEFWSTIEPLSASAAIPSARFGICCASGGDGKAFCFGGTDAAGERNDMWRYEEATNTWTEITGATGPIPGPRRYAACSFTLGSDGPRFYLYGGEEASGKTIADGGNSMFMLRVVPSIWSTVSQPTATMSAVTGGVMKTCTTGNGTIRTVLFGGKVNPETAANTWNVMNPITYSFDPLAHAEAADLPARSFHSAAFSGVNLFVFGGRSAAGAALDDFWKYDSTTLKWLEVDFVAGTPIPPARYGAATASNGAGIIYIHGGFASAGNALDDLWAIDTERAVARNVWTVSSASQPSRRGYHYCVFIGTVLVCGGGISVAGAMTTISGAGESAIVNGDFWTYALVTQKWAAATVYSEGGTIAPRFGAIITTVNDTHAVVGLGADKEKLLLDFFWLTNVSENGGSFTSRSILTSSPTDTEKRNYQRVAAAAAAVGNVHLIVCGGKSAVSSLVAPPVSLACYKLRLDTGVFIELSNTPSFAARMGATMLHFTNMLFLYGGRATEDRTVLTTTSPLLSKLIFDASALCADTDINNPNCYPCSGGTKKTPTTCEPTPPGSFRPAGSSTANPCPLGTANPKHGMSSAAACAPCAFGYSTPSGTGASSCTKCDVSTVICPIGASQESSFKITDPAAFYLKSSTSSSTASSTVVVETHPEPFTPPSAAQFWLPILIIALFIGLGILLPAAYIMYRDYSDRSKLLSYFFDGDSIRRLGELYATGARGRYGLTEHEFFEVLASPESVEFFPAISSSFSASDAHALFSAADPEKLGYLNKDGFLSAAILVIVRGFIPPMPGTKAEEQLEQTGKILPEQDDDDALATALGLTPTTKSIFQRRLRLNDADMFSDKHQREGVGAPIKLQKTKYGGLLSVLFAVVALVIIVITILDAVMNSIVENNAVVPRAVVQSEFGITSLAVSAEQWTATVRVAGVSRTRPGIQNFREACVRDDAGTCTSAVITTTNITVGRNTTGGGTTTINCFYSNTTRTCTVVWVCRKCSVPDGGAATALLSVSSAISAHYISVSFDTTTGIRNPLSSNGASDFVGGPELHSSLSAPYLRPSDNDSVITGFPATTFPVALTPTFFSSDTLANIVTNAAPYKAVGYHVRQGSSTPTIGQTARPSDFDSLFDVPVEFKFSADSTPVLVRRQSTVTLVTILTSIAGGISGVISFGIVAVHLLDYLLLNPEHKPESVFIKQRRMRAAAAVMKAARKFKEGMLRARKSREEKHAHLEQDEHHQQQQEDAANVNPLIAPKPATATATATLAMKSPSLHVEDHHSDDVNIVEMGDISPEQEQQPREQPPASKPQEQQQQQDNSEQNRPSFFLQQSPSSAMSPMHSYDSSSSPTKAERSEMRALQLAARREELRRGSNAPGAVASSVDVFASERRKRDRAERERTEDALFLLRSSLSLQQAHGVLALLEKRSGKGKAGKPQ